MAVEPASTQANPVSPFRQLRQTTFGYHGLDVEFTNLTEIPIGWFGPTNADDPLTGGLWRAANLAVREANEQRARRGPPGSFQSLPVRLVPRWSVDPWGTGVSQLTRMVYDEQPLALLGSVDSASTHLAEQVVAKANLPLVSPVATDPSVTLAGVSWMFSCAPSDSAIGRALVDAILADLTLATEPAAIRPKPGLVLLTCTDHESRMTTRQVLKELSRRGCQPDFRFEVPPGANAISQQMAALQEARPAAVLILAGAEDSARLVLALRKTIPPGFGARQSPGAFAGAEPTRGAGDEKHPRQNSPAEPPSVWRACAVFGAHSMGRSRFLELAGPAAEGVQFPLLSSLESNGPKAARFAELFTAENRRPPDYAAALTYDATRLLIDAIERAGPSRARIREALTGLSPWSGVAGPIRFDGTGQNARANLGMAVIRGGRIIPGRQVLANTTSRQRL